MSSAALVVFERLMEQVSAVRAAAGREAAGGHHGTGPVLLRSAVVLSVAAFDTYVHERGVELLKDRAASGATEASDVARFLGGGTTAADITGGSAELFIRYRLSYRTLVSPLKVDEVIAASGRDAERVWLEVALALGSRPDRLRALVQLQYDRRNQIAHEGDWDSVALDFRPLEEVHLDDCVRCLEGLAQHLDALL